ncbi:MAG: type II toxin-antitoxin system HicB family antitoxin [Clostridia bacterium]
MFVAYPACFFKEDNGYSVIFPDLDYTATCGDTLEDALKMAVDCLAGRIYSSKRDGDVILPPSALEQISLEAVAHELGYASGAGFVNIITVDVEEYAKRHFERSVKKTLTIPDWLNTAALEQGINFSQVLQEALCKRLGYES